jgi:predicted patatin/cPLA2 family phospholipase
MEQCMRRHAETETAFLKMRTCAGNSDVKEMVVKFLQREQTYASLLQSINRLETKYDDLVAQTEQKKAHLHTLQIDNDNKKRVNEQDERQFDRDLAHKLKEHPEEASQQE